MKNFSIKKFIINNKEIDENEFWNKIDKIKEQFEV